MNELDPIRHRAPLGISASHIKRADREVEGNRRGAIRVFERGNRDTAASRANIGKARTARNMIHRVVHEKLGLGARNQTIGCYNVIFAVEISLAENIGERDAPTARLKGRVELGRVAFGVKEKVAFLNFTDFRE